MNIKVIGIGSAGLKMIETALGRGLPPSVAVAIHSDPRMLAGSRAAEKLNLDEAALRQIEQVSATPGGNGAGESPAPKAEQEIPATPAANPLASIRTLCAGCEAVFILAGLGMGMGSRASEHVARVAKANGALVLAFVTLPFECEGSVCCDAADASLARLKSAATLVASLPHQKSLALINDATGLKDSFAASNHIIAGSVIVAWQAMNSENALGRPFLELCADVASHAPGCLFAVADAAGPNRAAEVAERLLASPVLDGPASLRRSSAIAAVIVGGPGLGVGEVNRIMNIVQKQCPGVPMVMGAGSAAQLGDSLIAGLMVAQMNEANEAAIAEKAGTSVAGDAMSSDLASQLLNSNSDDRSQSRFSTAASSENGGAGAARAPRGGGRARAANSSKLRQTQLPLDVISKGRFEKSEPTIHKGQDLDLPTYIRRGVALN